jgi:hypothetical protein
LNGMMMRIEWKGQDCGLLRESPRNPCDHYFLIGPGGRLSQEVHPSKRVKARGYIHYEVAPTLSQCRNYFNRTIPIELSGMLKDDNVHCAQTKLIVQMEGKVERRMEVHKQRTVRRVY